jgi:hypothetical protein
VPQLIAGAAAIVCAVPVAIFVNALRVAALVQAHHWLVPLFPDSFRAAHRSRGVSPTET